MNKKGLAFALLLLAFVSVPSTIAVPASRSLRSIAETETTSNHLNDAFQAKGRMDMEVADYSGTGANSRHDPRPPGSI